MHTWGQQRTPLTREADFDAAHHSEGCWQQELELVESSKELGYVYETLQSQQRQSQDMKLQWGESSHFWNHMILYMIWME